MRTTTFRRTIIAALALAAAASALPARSAGVKLELVATGLTEPVHVTHAGDGSGRLFIIERAGVVKILSGGQVLAAPFADIRDLVGDAFLEQGLLSIAFHPSYASNGRVFFSYTDLLGRNVLARYRVSATNPNAIDPSSAEVLFTQVQPFLNHNGGLVEFGPDGYLYMGIGDGGTANDPTYQGANPQTLLGTIIRIDVDSVASGYAIPPSNPFVGDPTGADEIWAYGLRNPWKFSFDPAGGGLYIADVGQNNWEEVNVEPGGFAGGRNYGWNRYEGNHALMPELFPPLRPYVFPVLEYDHADGCSITGGHVYRGSALPALTGKYIFGEYCRGTIWTMDTAGLTGAPGETRGKTTLLQSQTAISSFGVDEAGEIYVAHLGLVPRAPGQVYKIVAA